MTGDVKKGWGGKFRSYIGLPPENSPSESLTGGPLEGLIIGERSRNQDSISDEILQPSAAAATFSSC